MASRELGLKTRKQSINVVHAGNSEEPVLRQYAGWLTLCDGISTTE